MPELTSDQIANCDHGWIHTCGGPHAPENDQDTRTLVPIPGPGDAPCLTVRCPEHCSCFAPDGVHIEECALHG